MRIGMVYVIVECACMKKQRCDRHIRIVGVKTYLLVDFTTFGYLLVF